MKFRGTLIFALVVFAVIGYAVFDFKKVKKAEEVQSESEKILPFSPGQVTGFSLKRADEAISLEKRDGKWWLVQPLEDLADEDNVSNFLAAITNEKGKVLQPKEGQAIGWADYSLDPVGAELEVKIEGKDEPSRVSISKLAAFDGSYFVRRGDSLILGTSAWAGYMDKEVGHFRTKVILRTGNVIESVRIAARDSEPLEVRRKDGSSPWEVKGIKWSVDQSRVDGIVNALKELRAMGYLPEGKTPESLKKYNLHRPHLSIQVKFIGGDQAKGPSHWELKLTGDKDGEVYATTSDGSGLFRLPGSSIGSLRLGKADLRDRREPFRLSVEEIREITVADGKETLALRKEGSEWKPKTIMAGKTFNVGGVTLLLQKVEALRVEEFLSDQRVKPSGEGLRRVEFKGDGQKLLLALEIGDEYTSHEGERKGNKYIKVKSSLAGQVVGVPPAHLSDLKMSMFFNDTKSDVKSEN